MTNKETKELREQLENLRFKNMATVDTINDDGKHVDYFALNDHGAETIMQLLDQHMEDALHSQAKAILAAPPVPNPKEWAANQPQMAWTLGYEKAVNDYTAIIKRIGMIT